MTKSLKSKGTESALNEAKENNKKFVIIT